MAAAGLALAALIVGSMIVGSSIIMLLASVLAVAASMVSPLIGMVVLTFMAPLPRPLILPTPGLHVAIIAAIFLGTVFRLPIDRPRLRLPALEVVLLGAFLLYAAAHFLGGRLDGYAGPRSFEIAQLFAQLMTGVLAFGVAYIVLRDRSPYPVLAAILASALLACGLAIAQSQGFEANFDRLLPHREIDLGRATGPFLDPNYFGSFLAVAITLAVACAVIVKLRWLRVSLLALAAFVSVTLALTQSRGALLAVIAGLIAVAFTRGRRVGIFAVATMVLVIVIAYPLFTEWRFGANEEGARIGLSTEADSSGRVGAVLAGQELFLSSPLFGIGFGRFLEESSIGIVAHNWYMSVAAELGITGIVLWALFIVAVALALSRTSRSARTVGYSALAAWMVASLTLEVPTAYQVTGPVLIIVAAACVGDWAPTHPGVERAVTPTSRSVEAVGPSLHSSQ